LKTAAETPAATTEPTESNGSTTEEASGSTESASDSTGVPPIPQ